MSTFINPAQMPAIGLSEEQAQLIDIAASFCRDKSPVDAVRALLEEDTGFNPDIWQEIAELGWLGIGIPDTYGGIGLGLGEIVPIVEQMGRHLLTTPYVSTVLAAQAVLRGGTESVAPHEWHGAASTGAEAGVALSAPPVTLRIGCGGTHPPVVVRGLPPAKAVQNGMAVDADFVRVPVVHVGIGT